MKQGQERKSSSVMLDIVKSFHGEMVGE